MPQKINQSCSKTDKNTKMTVDSQFIIFIKLAEKLAFKPQ